MQSPSSRILTLALAGIFTVAALDASAARTRRHHAVEDASSNSAESAFWRGAGSSVPVENGVPIIMKGYHPPAPAKEEPSQRRADRAVHIPRGSSSFVDIPPPTPSPYSRNSPPAAALTQPSVQPYNPPHITTFSDKVTNAIHDYPLQNGIGNNPTDQQMFIRQRANQ